jgi:hypothetical protein
MFMILSYQFCSCSVGRIEFLKGQTGLLREAGLLIEAGLFYSKTSPIGQLREADLMYGMTGHLRETYLLYDKTGQLREADQLYGLIKLIFIC